MKRHATDRLATAVVMAMAGAFVALFVGTPAAALVVTPWVVLLVLGLGHAAAPDLSVNVEASPQRVIVGDEIDLTVRAQGDADLLVQLSPRLGSLFADDDVPASVEAMVAGESVQAECTLEVNEWGAHDLGRVDIEARAPFGLFRWSGTRQGRTMVRVHPTSHQLRELLTPSMVRRVSGTHGSKESAQGIEYADIRQFAPGDSVRDINWRASARAGELWISQRHPDRTTDVLLMVDSFVESGHDTRKVFGAVLEASVGLAESHLSATDRVGLIEFGGVVRWVTPRTGRVQLQQLVDALLSTGLYANSSERELPVLPVRALPPRSFVIAMTPLLDQRFIDAVFEIRGRGHDVAVIECVSFDDAGPDVEAHADRPAAQLGLRMWRAERAVLRDRMAEQGIAVGAWKHGESLDVTLAELTRRRRRVVGARGR